MANAVQWTVQQFYGQTQVLGNKFAAVAAALDADKSELTHLYTQARNDTDRKRGAANMALLQPLIHRNSELRLTYLKPIRQKFDQAVALTRTALRKVGINPPNLAGLGVVIAFAPLTAITLILAALALVATAAYLTDAQRTRTRALAAAMNRAKSTDEVL